MPLQGSRLSGRDDGGTDQALSVHPRRFRGEHLIRTLHSARGMNLSPSALVPLHMGCFTRAGHIAFIALAGLLAGSTTGCAVESTTGIAADFVAIDQVAPAPAPAVPGPDASTGTFTVDCGRNESGHRNADNFITLPGDRGGAHHLHEYVGNVSADAGSTDTSLAAADTTCTNGDRSTIFWPVLLDRATTRGHNAGGRGTIIPPASVEVRYHGNPASQVLAMPRFLRIITGDAKALTSGGAAARARWSCAADPDRFTTSYPLCSPGEQVVRTFDFPSCWDGRNTDSPDHRSHMAFPSTNGTCPRATFPVPHLVVRVFQDVAEGRSFLTDSFPEQKYSSVTDHGDYTNVMTDELMTSLVACLNEGRTC